MQLFILNLRYAILVDASTVEEPVDTAMCCSKIIKKYFSSCELKIGADFCYRAPKQLKLSRTKLMKIPWCVTGKLNLLVHRTHLESSGTHKWCSMSKQRALIWALQGTDESYRKRNASTQHTNLESYFWNNRKMWYATMLFMYIISYQWRSNDNYLSN